LRRALSAPLGTLAYRLRRTRSTARWSMIPAPANPRSPNPGTSSGPPTDPPRRSCDGRPRDAGSPAISHSACDDRSPSAPTHCGQWTQRRPRHRWPARGPRARSRISWTRSCWSRSSCFCLWTAGRSGRLDPLRAGRPRARGAPPPCPDRLAHRSNRRGGLSGMSATANTRDSGRSADGGNAEAAVPQSAARPESAAARPERKRCSPHRHTSDKLDPIWTPPD
jgi:hypothetical protein